MICLGPNRGVTSGETIKHLILDEIFITKNLRILIIEDEDFYLTHIVKLLRKIGFT